MARIFITGSSDGLGFMAGLPLASDGHEAALHARNEARDVVIGDVPTIASMRSLTERANAPGGHAARPELSIFGLTSLARMRYMLKNVPAICEAAGTTLEKVVRCACFHDTGERFAQSMDEWVARFPERKPSSTTLIIGGPLVVPGAHTLLDLIADVPD